MRRPELSQGIFHFHLSILLSNMFTLGMIAKSSDKAKAMHGFEEYVDRIFPSRTLLFPIPSDTSGE